MVNRVSIHFAASPLLFFFPPMPSPSTHIKTPRLLLRPILASDRDGFIDLLTTSKDHFAPWWPLPLPGDTPAIIFDRHLERQAVEHASGLGFRRGAFLRDGPSSGALVGLVNLGQISAGRFCRATSAGASTCGISGVGWRRRR